MNKLSFLFLSFFLFLAGSNKTMANETKWEPANNGTWKVGGFKYEGYPLLLRVPVNIKYDSWQRKYPLNIAVTHVFEHVKANGLPEAEYNKSLIEFDHFLTYVLEKEQKGVTILIETFGGKRTYYMYSEEGIDLIIFRKQIEEKYPEYKIEFDSMIDPAWNFIKDYAEDWGF